MGAEAVVRVQRQAGTLGRTIRGVRDEVDELTRSLEAVDPRLGAAVQAIETYRQKVRAGGQLSEREHATYQQLTDFAGRAASPAIGMTYERAVATAAVPGTTNWPRQLETYLAQPLPGAPPATAPSPATPSGASRALTAEERASYLQRGYTEEQLDRSRLLGETLLVRPPRRAAEPESGEAVPDSDPVIPGQQTPQAVADDVEEASDQATEAVDRRAAAQRRLREQQDLSSLSEQQLRREWQRTQVDLRAQDRDLDRAIGQLDKLRERRQRGLLDDAEAVDEQRSKIEDLYQGRSTLSVHEANVRAEAHARGYQVDGDTLRRPESEGSSGTQRALGAFVSGAGFGSGSIGGGLAGMALGMMSPATVIPALLGAAAVKGYKVAEDAYGKYVEQLQHTEPIGRTVGATGSELVSQALRDAYRSGVFTLPDLYQGMQAAARGTGTADLSATLPVASVTGQMPAAVVQQQVALQRVAPSLDPTLMARLLGEYDVANVSRGGGTALFPHFTDVVARTAGGMQQPLTRIPVDALAAQIGAASYLDFPGIDMAGGGPIAADVAGEFVGGVNRWVGRPATGGGALEDARLLGIIKLRGTELAERLKKELDIDIDTISGTRRAAERAPELALRGFPEVARATIGAEKDLFGDTPVGRDLYEQVLRGRGVESELAHQMATRDIENLYGMKPSGPAVGLDQRAAAVAQSSDAQRVYEWNIHPELMGVRAGEQFDDSGLIINRNYNDFKDSVVKVLAEGADRLTSGVLGLLGAEVHAPGGVGQMEE